MARFSVVVLLLLGGCRPSPFQVTNLSSKGPTRVELIESTNTAWNDDKKARLKKHYQALKQPTFALVDGYYHLPKAQPFGSVTLMKGVSYLGEISVIHQESARKDYTLEPFKGDDALRFNQGINALLDLGVRIVHISMADALEIAKAEEQAASKTHRVPFEKLLPPAADYLISIDTSPSEKGPLLIGRVISKDGRLLAFKVASQSSSALNFTDLLLELFDNTLTRLDQ